MLLIHTYAYILDIHGIKIHLERLKYGFGTTINDTATKVTVTPNTSRPT